MRTSIKVLAFIMVGVFFLINGVAFSQEDYPAKPVTMLHGFRSGGNADTLIRILSDALSKLYNQTFLLVSKPGGAQTIAASSLARSAPDGYTVGTFYQGLFTTVPYLQEVPYKFEDLRPVIGWHNVPELLVCKSDAPYKNLKDVVAAAKTQRITFGHNGKGSLMFMAPTIFAKRAGIKLHEVPFKGDSEQIVAVLGGHIDLAVLSGGFAVSFLESGKIRGLVNFDTQRSPYSPEVPTFEEQGYPMEFGVPVGMTFVPKGTPDAAVRKLHDGIKQCISDPQVKAQFTKMKQNLCYVDAKGMLKIIEKEKKVFYPILKEVGLAK